MNEIEEIILKVYKDVLQEMDINGVEANAENNIGRGSGLGSLGFVNLIVGIEEEFDICLDAVLIALRETKNLQEVITIVSNFVNRQKIELK